ncbi:MAG TPA: flavodoxin [bacterium]|nr:flavodoxin [bacterium]
MKKHLLTAVLSVLTAALLAAAEPQPASPTEEAPAMETKEAKVLVVYFSRSGNTGAVAKELAAGLGADSEALTEQGTDWSGVWGYFKAGKAAWKEEVSSIEKLKKEPKDYDLVVIGTPIWAWNMTPAVRAFLTVYKDDIKKIAFFATEGGSGHEKAFKNMEAIAGKRPVATGFWLEKEVKDPAKLREKISAYVIDIKKTLPPSTEL